MEGPFSINLRTIRISIHVKGSTASAAAHLKELADIYRTHDMLENSAPSTQILNEMLMFFSAILSLFFLHVLDQ